MPTLFRILLVFGVIIGLGYAAIWALATKVEPQQREITITVPAERLEQ